MNVIQNVKQSIHSRKFTRRNRSIGGDLGLILLLGAFACFTAYPLVYAINHAFKPMSEMFLFPPNLFVQNPTMDNFLDLGVVLEGSWIPITRYLFNTVLITIAGTIGSVVFGTMAAYPLAKFEFPGQKLMSSIIIYALMFNGTVTAIPSYIMMSQLGLVNTYWAVILPVLAGTLGLYLMKNFIVQIPMALIESAKIDGATEMKIFWNVIIPLCKPAWVTVCIFSFQALWNATGGNFIYTEELKPLNYALGQMITGSVARQGVAAAVQLIMMSVPIIFFVISQANVIETMATSGMKD